MQYISEFLNFQIGFDQFFKPRVIQRSLDKKTIDPILRGNFPIFRHIIACNNENGNIGMRILMENEFTQLFPEWVLCESLRKSNNRFSLWNSKVVPLTDAPQPLKSFAEIFPGVRDTGLKAERSFKKEEYTYFGFGDKKDLYEKYYWSLRPDFLIEDQKNQLLLLVEAKGGEINQTAWKKPKEASYYDFLRECGGTFLVRGFFILFQRSLPPISWNVYERKNFNLMSRFVLV